MKTVNEFKIYLLIIGVLLLASCRSNENENENLIKGKWKAVSIVNYSNGQETTTTFSEEDLLTKPQYLEVNEYGEVVYYDIKNGYRENVRAFSYTVDGDSLRLDGGGNQYIKELTPTSLITTFEWKIDYFDKTDAWGKGKWLMTTHYVRVSE